MIDIPFEAAKQFCEEYQKHQCIILSWDETTGDTWVTTYGVGEKNSIQATHGGNLIKDFLELKREHDEIPIRFEEWKIESVERHWQRSGRNSKTYREVTHWFEPHTMKRKETIREEFIYDGQEYRLPDWAKGITKRISSVADNYIY
ncbi:MAG: hypothetical protein PHQ67_05585 [Fermentimonas sp.]|nr:hypothetical protein [Fermentimonas sp.]